VDGITAKEKRIRILRLVLVRFDYKQQQISSDKIQAAAHPEFGMRNAQKRSRR
jgi:hypothetical protein